MKLAYVLPLLTVAFAAEAHASEAQIQLRAYVPTSCDMSFSPHVERLTDSSFSIGSIQQFCNTNYQLTLYHAAVGSGSEFGFGDRIVAAGAGSTVLQSSGRPTIATKQLIARGLNAASADALSHSLMLQVTPLAL
jgi:hypothetical protein